MPISQTNLVFKRSALTLLFERALEWLYKSLTQRALPIFTRGTDIGAVGPNVLGYHELQTMTLINKFTAEGQRDFLLDIGANVGVISCQCADKFDYFIMFEPNPLLAGVLQTNAAIALPSDSFEIIPIALGEEESIQTLKVPRHNWGGAYIISDSNSYDEKTLYSKDGFSQYEESNYLSLQVQVRSADQALARVFSSLTGRGLTRGVVKIDVEGMEMPILKAIAQSLPDDFEVSIVFENWGLDFQGAVIEEAFNGRAHLSVLERYPSGCSKSALQFIKLMVLGKQVFSLKPWSASQKFETLVLSVSAIKSINT